MDDHQHCLANAIHRCYLARTQAQHQRTDLTVAKNTKDNAFDLATAQLQGQTPLKAAQWDDQTAEASTQFWPSLPKGTRLVGVCQVTAQDSKVGVAVQDFWQRWPKEFALDNDGLTIGILPRLKGLRENAPYYLLYPFLEGSTGKLGHGFPNDHHRHQAQSHWIS